MERITAELMLPVPSPEECSPALKILVKLYDGNGTFTSCYGTPSLFTTTNHCIAPLSAYFIFGSTNGKTHLCTMSNVATQWGNITWCLCCSNMSLLIVMNSFINQNNTNQMIVSMKDVLHWYWYIIDCMAQVEMVCCIITLLYRMP